MDVKRDKRETIKACFIGGVLFTATAFWLAPMFWWLGTLAGLAGGYFGYEFRSVLRAVPKAWQAAQEEMGFFLSATKEIIPKIISVLVNYMRKPRPFGYLSLPIAMIAVHVLPKNSQPPLSFIVFFLLIFWLFFCMILSDVAGRALIKDKYFFEGWQYSSAVAQKIGLTEIPLTYRNAFFYTAKGFGMIIIFLAWTLWKYLFIGIAAGVVFIGRFLKHFFILVHSSETYKRIFCAITGTAGGMTAFLFLSPGAQTLAAKIMVVIFGGFLGAAFGAILREVSLRWLPRDVAAEIM